MTLTIYFVRHGLVHNPKSVFYGRLPGFYLSKVGKKQAEAAAAYLADVPLSAVFTSPMERARQTADIILAHQPQATRRIAPRLNEIVSPFEGKPVSVAASHNWNGYSQAGPEHEQPSGILARVRDFIADMRATYDDGEAIAAVSHGDVIAFLTLWVKGLSVSAEEKRRFGVYPDTASITRLTFQTADLGETPAYQYIKPYE